MRRWTAGNEEAIAFYKLSEGVANGVSGTSDTNGLHHTRVAQLTTAELTIKQLSFTKEEEKQNIIFDM